MNLKSMGINGNGLLASWSWPAWSPVKMLSRVCSLRDCSLWGYSLQWILDVFITTGRDSTDAHPFIWVPLSFQGRRRWLSG